MRYATAMVGERETPAWQWMRTPEREERARSMNPKASSKNWRRFWKGKKISLNFSVF